MHCISLPAIGGKAPAKKEITVTAGPPRIQSVPMDDWPSWTWLVMLARKPEDKGLGDTVVHLIGDARSARFKEWFQQKFGKTCGCTERQRWLNQKFPYANDVEVNLRT